LVQFKITCSKGTYIRSIANDFGKLLQSGAYLNSLCRTQIGKFKLENAYTMQDLIAYFGEEISLKTDL
jgi:tRNA pseudouridine55 synthase